MLPPHKGAPAMVFRILSVARHAGWLALGVAAVCAASSACSNNSPSPADAFVDAHVGIGGDPTCNLKVQQTFVGIGTAVAGKPVTVNDGDTQSGSSQVHVSCSVTTAANGFDVSLSASMEGLQGGSLTITSPPGQGAVTESGGSGIRGTFQSANSGVYSENDCTITYTYNSSAVPDTPAIAAGRIWGHISCPNAKNSGSTTVGADGGATNVTCDAEADFLFEQCGQ
jgi:hypothetical protein